MTEHIGCGDNSCMFGGPGGMATNGGCRCLPESMSPGDRRDVRRGVAALRARVASLEQELEGSRAIALEVQLAQAETNLALKKRVAEADRLLRGLRMPPCMDDPIEWVGIEGDWIERREKWLSGSDTGSL